MTAEHCPGRLISHVATAAAGDAIHMSLLSNTKNWDAVAWCVILCMAILVIIDTSGRSVPRHLAQIFDTTSRQISVQTLGSTKYSHIQKDPHPHLETLPSGYSKGPDPRYSPHYSLSSFCVHANQSPYHVEHGTFFFLNSRYILLVENLDDFSRFILFPFSLMIFERASIVVAMAVLRFTTSVQAGSNSVSSITAGIQAAASGAPAQSEIATTVDFVTIPAAAVPTSAPAGNASSLLIPAISEAVASGATTQSQIATTIDFVTVPAAAVPTNVPAQNASSLLIPAISSATAVLPNLSSSLPANKSSILLLPSKAVATSNIQSSIDIPAFTPGGRPTGIDGPTIVSASASIVQTRSINTAVPTGMFRTTMIRPANDVSTENIHNMELC